MRAALGMKTLWIDSAARRENSLQRDVEIEHQIGLEVVVGLTAAGGGDRIAGVTARGALPHMPRRSASDRAFA